MPATPSSLESITLDQLREQWPQDESGRLCARLLQRYCYTRLVDSALGHESTDLRAQAESAAAKAMAAFTKDFASLATPAPEKTKRKPMATLHRFQQQQPAEPNTENK